MSSTSEGNSHGFEDGDECKYQLCLKAEYRSAFLKKFQPIFTVDNPQVHLGGQNGECWIVSGYLAQKCKGGPRASYQVYLSGRTLRVTLSAAKAAVMFRMIQKAIQDEHKGDIEWAYAAGSEASHLCHSSNCIRPDHIVIESKEVNQDRNFCSGRIQCLECLHWLSACRHDPECIWLSNATVCSACSLVDD